MQTCPRGLSGSTRICMNFCSPRLYPMVPIPFTSLNALPFASNDFDFVRIRYIGLAVPEDKVSNFVPRIDRVSSS